MNFDLNYCSPITSHHLYWKTKMFTPTPTPQCILGSKMVTQSYKASNNNNNNNNNTIKWSHEKRAQLANQLKIEIAQKLLIFHIPYFLK